MNCRLSSITEKIIQTLKAADSENKYTFTVSFPATVLSSPVARPTVGVGIKRVEFADCSVGSYLGTDGDHNEIFGRKCTVTLAVSVFSPRKNGGMAAAACFEEISDMLLSSEASKDISEIVCTDTVSDRVSDCFAVQGEISLVSVIYTAEKKSNTAENFTVEGETV